MYNLNMTIWIDKPQRGHPKRAELPDVNINTGTQSINTERTSLNLKQKLKKHACSGFVLRKYTKCIL